MLRTPTPLQRTIQRTNLPTNLLVPDPPKVHGRGCAVAAGPRLRPQLDRRPVRLGRGAEVRRPPLSPLHSSFATFFACPRCFLKMRAFYFFSFENFSCGPFFPGKFLAWALACKVVFAAGCVRSRSRRQPARPLAARQRPPRVLPHLRGERKLFRG